VGPYRGSTSNTIATPFKRSAFIRRNSRLKVVNSILMDYPIGLFIKDAATITSAGNGTTLFANNLVAGNQAGKVIDPTGWTGSTAYTYFANNNNDSAVATTGILTSPYNYTSPDYRPATSSAALSNYSFSQTLIAPYVIAQTVNKNFVVPVDYRGAFAPSPSAMWTNGWANWDPQNTAYGSTTVTINSDITTNTTWTKNNVYKLSGLIYIDSLVTLTIEPGTIIRGDSTVGNSSLIVRRGAKLNAIGTVAEPIVFTSQKSAGNRAPGNWGGIIILGKATYNGSGAFGGTGTGNIEGITASNKTIYGGGTSPDDNDNSGTLKYVRIEFGGFQFATNQEINGLTMGGVGRGTTIDYVQSSFINDDAFEWFGGTVNCAHLISYRSVDDEFDTDNGFSGSVQFCLGVRDPQYADAVTGGESNGFESDNDAAGSTNQPYTSAIFSNVTLVGPYRGSTSNTIATPFKRSAFIRRNSRLKVLNSILLDYPIGVFIKDASTIASANAGTTRFSNNLLAGNQAGKVIDPTGWSGSTAYTWFATNKNDSSVSTSGILTSPYSYTSPDYRPVFGSLATQNYNFSDTVFNGLINTTPCVAPSIGSISGLSCLPATTAANTTYTIDSISGATCTWTVPTGVKIISGQGTRTLVVKSLLTTTVINGNISVVVTNSCGSTSFATLAIKKVGPIGKLVAINGSADPCNGIGSGYSLTYTTSKVANAEGYLWTSVGGTVISSNDTTATIRFNKISTGSVSVKAYGFCGTDTVWGVVLGKIVKTTLPTASAVTGTTDGCAGIGTGNSLPYTAATATNASTYIWTVPTLATLISGQGTQNINVSFPDNFAAGAIAVKAGRVCGTDTFFSAAKSLTLKTLLPVKPTAITSSTSLDPCSKLGTSETYSVAATANTTNYLWSTTGTGASVSSNGTVNGVVDYTTAFRSGSVSVKAQRACGSSTFSSGSIAVTLKVALPSTPVVSGLSTPCRNVTGVYKAASNNATSYTWTAATGLSLVSAAVDSAIVTTSASFTKASLSVYATRACGTTSINSVAKISGLVRPAIGCAPGSRAINDAVAANLANVNDAFIVYPNPSRGGFTVTVKNNSKATMATIQIVNLFGQVVKTYNASNNNGLINYNVENADLTSGLYLVKYTVGETTGTTKLSINK